jgi:hypothetical protein
MPSFKADKIIKFIKNEWFFLSLVIICSLVFASLCIHKGHNWGGDFSLYISQAISVNHNSLFDLYNQNKFSMDHSEILFGPYLYPMGFPLILSVVYLFAGMDFVIMKWVGALFFLASLPLIYLIFKNYFTERKYAFALLVCIALHENFLTFTDNVLSDLPFLFFSLLAIYLMERSKTFLQMTLLGLVIFYAYFVRDIGVFLIPTLFVFQAQKAFQNKKEFREKKLFLLIPYVVFLFFFGLSKWILPAGGGNHYAIFYNMTFTTRLLNYYAELLSAYLFDSTISVFLWIPLLLLILTGMYIHARKGIHILFYVLIIFVISVMWPSKQGIRFLFPIIPFILYFLFQGLIYLSKIIKFKYLNISIFLFAAIIVFENQKKVIRFSRVDTNAVKSEQMEDLYDCVIRNTDEKSVVVFDNPRVLRLFTERNSFYSTNNDTVRMYADYSIRDRNDFIDISWMKSIDNTDKYTLYKIE